MKFSLKIMTSLLLCLTIRAEQVVIDKKFYKICWDNSTGTVLWAEHLIEEHDESVPRLRKKYIKDKSVENSASSNDYIRSGYDRGHLVPVGDLNFSRDAINSTFVTSNISPQKPELNRCGWLRLEKATRGWLKKGSKLNVVTGPLFFDRQQTQKIKDKIPIPEAFFKAIYCPQRQSAIAFIMPNRSAPEPLPYYQISVPELERISGFSLFPKIEKKHLTKTKKSAFFRKPLIFLFNLSFYFCGIFMIAKAHNRRQGGNK